MSDARELRDKLQRVRARELLNRALAEGRGAVVGLLTVALAAAAWNALAPLRWGIGPLLPAAVAAAVVAHRVARLWPRDSLAAVAARVDREAGLEDELTSAWWFARRGGSCSDWVEHHLERAAATAGGLDPARLVPIRRPGRLYVPALLAAGLGVVLLAPVPRAGDLLAERLAELRLPVESEPVAELREAIPEAEPAPEAPEDPGREVELPVLDEEAESHGEEALPEEASPTPGEEAPEGEPGAESEAAEQTGSEEPGESGEATEGEQVAAENAQEMPGAEGRRAAPEPSASQQQGAGEPAEEQGAMLPGGDEVFLQEGGEDMQRSGEAEEEMGHATRKGGGEEELEAGEALTPLDVQLRREILALPEDAASPEEDEETEERLTRAERSLLELQAIDPGAEFGRQELMSGEPIPWRYRSLVLDYFRALRERDNQQREESP